VRSRAAALSRIGAEPKKVVHAIVPLLKDDSEKARTYAVSALAHLGPAAMEAVPALVEAANGPDAKLRNLILGALREIDYRAIKQLKDKPE
jgi:HEAT repeat protein